MHQTVTGLYRLPRHLQDASNSRPFSSPPVAMRSAAIVIPLKIRAAYSFVLQHLPFLKVLLGEPRARRFSSPPVAMRSAAIVIPLKIRALTRSSYSTYRF